MKDKTTEIRKLAKEKSINREKEVLKAIKAVKKSGEKVSFYGIAKLTGASKSYLYKNEKISNEIKKCRDEAPPPRKPQSEKTIINAQQMEIRKLKKLLEDKENENSDSYKEKYEKLKAENADLKKQLANAYSVWN